MVPGRPWKATTLREHAGSEPACSGVAGPIGSAPEPQAKAVAGTFVSVGRSVYAAQRNPEPSRFKTDLLANVPDGIVLSREHPPAVRAVVDVTPP